MSKEREEAKKKALNILKQQPTAGDFTEKMHDKYKFFKFRDPRTEIGKDLVDACDRLDRTESINADLLEACISILAIKKWISHIRNAPKELFKDIEQIEAAISKAKQ